jgi:hypothetical protein
MSKCGVNRWGPGTTCERPIKSESSNELKQRLALLEAERIKQDNIWNKPSEPIIKNVVNQAIKTSSVPKYTSS